MSSKFLRNTDHTEGNAENNYFEESHKILGDLSKRMLQHDTHNILSHLQETDLIAKPGMAQLNELCKKLFHIDLKNREIYWEISAGQTRCVRKQCLFTKELRYKWQFDDKRIGSEKIIQVLGKHKYNQMKVRSMMNQDTLQTIHMNVLNNAYANFDDFLGALVQLINQNIAKVFDGRTLNKKNCKDLHKKEKIHQELWEWYSHEMTMFWKMLWEQIKTQGIANQYTLNLYIELEHLFKQKTEFKCKDGLTFLPLKKEQQLNYSYMRKQYGEASLRKNFEQSISLDYQSFHFDLDLNYSEIKEISGSKYLRFPHPENYMLTQTIELEDNYDEEMSQFLRKSMKRPANGCQQNCMCLIDDGVKCPNVERKIECENHSCKNSQIREKKEIFCWYLDEQKNNLYLDQISNKLTGKYLLTEYKAFGLDFYTVNVLYFLMPLRGIQDGQIVENQQLKICIIEKIIPYEISKTQNLFAAIKNIALNQEYEQYHYEARVLEKKLTWIRSMANQNALDKVNGLKLSFPKVCNLNGYYMGLGVLNVGLKIPKGKFIGKFVGELLCPWREEQKQIVSTKHNRKEQNEGNQIKFYCITVQSHFDQTAEPKCFTVDPQNVGNFCRSLNHSCDPNCKVEIMVSEGKYVLGVYAIKEIEHNQQLTFDYNSVTDNMEEYKNSVCLCGSSSCKGRYLNYKEEIQFSLDLDFLQKKFPIKDRIKKLMRHCFISDQKKKEKELQNSINILNERKVFYQCLPKKLGAWIYFWVRALNHTIFKENQFLSIKTRVDQSKMNAREREESQRLLTILQNEKLGTLNSKVEKIGHLFDKIKDFQPPFRSEPTQKVLYYLQEILRKSKKDLSVNSKIPKNIYTREESLLRIRKVRYGLLEMGFEELNKRNDLDKAHYYLEKAFTFSKVQTHIYPDYESQPIEIWMENAGKISEKVKFYGKDHFMLETLVAWPGQLKRIYKSYQFEERKNKKLMSKSEKNDINSQMDSQFKREYFKNIIKEAASQLEEIKYKEDKPEFIKNKKFMNKNLNLKKLKTDLDVWIEKELEFMHSQVNSLSKNIQAKNIGQDKSLTGSFIEFSRDSKKFGNDCQRQGEKSVEEIQIPNKISTEHCEVRINDSLISNQSQSSKSVKKIAKKGSKKQQKDIKKQLESVHEVKKTPEEISSSQFILKNSSSSLEQLNNSQKHPLKNNQEKKAEQQIQKRQPKPQQQTPKKRQKNQNKTPIKQAKQITEINKKQPKSKKVKNEKIESKPKKQPKPKNEKSPKKETKPKSEPKKKSQSIPKEKSPGKSATKKPKK